MNIFLVLFTFQGTLSKDEWEADCKFITIFPPTDASRLMTKLETSVKMYCFSQ